MFGRIASLALCGSALVLAAACSPPGLEPGFAGEPEPALPAPPPAQEVEQRQALQAGFADCSPTVRAAWFNQLLLAADVPELPPWQGMSSELHRSLGAGAHSLLNELRDHPQISQCVQDKLHEEFDSQPSAFIRTAAAWQGSSVSERPKARVSESFEEASQALCAAALSESCPSTGELPESMQQALIPLFDALTTSLAVMSLRRPPLAADWWWEFGGRGAVAGIERDAPNLAVPSHVDYLNAPRGPIYEEAARLAEAIEGVDWSAFKGLEVNFEMNTDAGVIAVRGAGDDLMPAQTKASLLWIDLGGDDLYLGPVASNASGVNTISLGIDLGGSDRYVPESVNPDTLELSVEGTSRVSVAGRFDQATAHPGGGPGGGRHGIALHYDFGDDDDHYRSYRFGLGYAHQGVGLLYDAGGNDSYLAEAVAMGAARSGIAALIDVSGDDVYEAEHGAQGLGQTAGLGVLFDVSGDDNYSCISPAQGPRYPAPQVPGLSASFCQGAGMGLRSSNEDIAAAGGLGLLLDSAGSDRYQAEVFGQGTAIQEGLGVLADRAGDDVYQGVWYVQGAAAHFAAGLLADGAGDDSYGLAEFTQHAALGVGHHFSRGIFFDAAGNDSYAVPSLGGGAGSCGGLGLFVELLGTDSYLVESDLSLGAATSAGACGEDTGRGNTLGLMIDGSGLDSYAGGLGFEGGQWGERAAEHISETAAGIDVQLVHGI